MVGLGGCRASLDQPRSLIHLEAGRTIREAATRTIPQGVPLGRQALQEHGFDSRDDLPGAAEHGVEDVEPPADQVEDAPPEGMIERPGKDRADDGAQPNSTT